jgi:DNA-binding winged helix-turn-helix (wHTH) protein
MKIAELPQQQSSSYKKVAVFAPEVSNSKFKKDNYKCRKVFVFPILTSDVVILREVLGNDSTSIATIDGQPYIFNGQYTKIDWA